MHSAKLLHITLLLIVCSFTAVAQQAQVSVEVGKININQDEPLLLTVIIRNSGERISPAFPNLPNFTKKAQSSSSKVLDEGTDTKVERRITQEYFANQPGTYRIATFSMKIGDATEPVVGFTVTVAPAAANEPDQFKDFIDGSAYDLVHVADDAFFAITTNNSRPYVGQGFLLTIAFYISNSNKAELDFMAINEQLDAILKKIRPQSCWEENLNINEVKPSGQAIKIGKKQYTQYKIYQANYYPLHNKTIYIAAQPWTMLKYKIAKDQAVSNAKKEDIKTYFSRSITISPQNLPKNIAVQNPYVGEYYITDKLEKNTVQTGRSSKYTVKVRGWGNLKLIELANTKSDTLFEIYDPQIKYSLTNINGRLIPEKTFIYDIVPKKAGTFSLHQYFYLQFFHVKTKKIEELHATEQLQAVGNTIADGPEIMAENDDIYSNIEKLQSNKTDFNISQLTYTISFIILIAMLLTFIYIAWPQKTN
jgi:hypothetical protein